MLNYSWYLKLDSLDEQQFNHTFFKQALFFSKSGSIRSFLRNKIFFFLHAKKAFVSYSLLRYLRSKKGHKER